MSAIFKAGVSGVIPQPAADEIIKDVYRGSLLLRVGTRKSVVGGKIRWANVGERPVAYFVGEGQPVSPSGYSIGANEAEARKIMALAVVSRESLEDASVDLFEEIRPELAEAIYRKIDQTYIFGSSKVPGIKSVFEVAAEAGNVVKLGSKRDLASDLQAVIRATNPTASTIAIDDDLWFDLADLRDANRRPLLNEIISGEGTLQRIYGRDLLTYPATDPVPVEYDGAYYRLRALGLADRALFVGVARELEYRILDQATITTPEGPVSLAQQDMVGILISFRIAAAVAADGRVSVGLEETEAPGDGGQGQE